MMKKRMNFVARTFSKLAFALSGMILMNSTLMAEVRQTDGKPCYPTEKTYYAEDGVTPFQCIPSGGPAFTFTVYDGTDVVWSGILPIAEPIVYFELPPKMQSAERSTTRLFVTRDLKTDPLGNSVFFGEEHLYDIEAYGQEGNVIQIPRMISLGKSVPKVTSKVTFKMGRIEGATIDFENYIFTVQPYNPPQ